MGNARCAICGKYFPELKVLFSFGLGVGEPYPRQYICLDCLHEHDLHRCERCGGIFPASKCYAERHQNYQNDPYVVHYCKYCYAERALRALAGG